MPGRGVSVGVVVTVQKASWARGLLGWVTTGQEDPTAWVVLNVSSPWGDPRVVAGRAGPGHTSARMQVRQGDVGG